MICMHYIEIIFIPRVCYMPHDHVENYLSPLSAVMYSFPRFRLSGPCEYCKGSTWCKRSTSLALANCVAPQVLMSDYLLELVSSLSCLLIIDSSAYGRKVKGWLQCLAMCSLETPPRWHATIYSIWLKMIMQHDVSWSIQPIVSCH